jgi:hypothetical protein
MINRILVFLSQQDSHISDIQRPVGSKKGCGFPACGALTAHPPGQARRVAFLHDIQISGSGSRDAGLVVRVVTESQRAVARAPCVAELGVAERAVYGSSGGDHGFHRCPCRVEEFVD